MSVISAELGEPHEEAYHQAPHIAEVTVPPVLITEQEVLFATAASTAAPPRRGPIWLAARVLRHLVGGRTPQTRPVKVHYPPRSRSYYESSVGGRERFRL